MSWVEQPSSAIMYRMATRDAAPENPQPRRELAKFVHDRRLELGLSVRTAADKGGVARGTWSALEEGSRRTADSNWAGVERALQWTHGSIAAILDGGRPTLSAGPPTPIQPPGETSVTAGSVAADRDEALRRVFLSDLPEDQKRRIAKILVDQKKEAERQRVENAEQLIRFARGED